MRRLQAVDRIRAPESCQSLARREESVARPRERGQVVLRSGAGPARSGHRRKRTGRTRDPHREVRDDLPSGSASSRANSPRASIRFWWSKRNAASSNCICATRFMPCASQPAILGKIDANGAPLFPPSGELDPDKIARVLARSAGEAAHDGTGRRRVQFLEDVAAKAAPAASVIGRSNFCSGCPHNRSTLLLEGQVGGGGIGCHTMAMRLTDSDRAFSLPHADGRRRRAVDRHGAVRRPRAHVPEHRRRDVFPFRLAGRAGPGRDRPQHHLQDSVQRPRRDDRRARRRRARCPFRS